MLKNVLTTAVICASSLLISACRSGNTPAVLVAGFGDEEPTITTITIPPSEWGEYSLRVPVPHGDRVCLLTGRIPEKKIMFLFDACEGVSGTGKISCNDGRAEDVQWSMASCRGGYGRSMRTASPGFFFGFGPDEEYAFNQLRTARNARQGHDGGRADANASVNPSLQRPEPKRSLRP